jgi:hypothetical protein
VLKESLHHLAAEADIDESISEVARVCRQRVVVVEPNPSFLLKIGRTLIRHLDPQCPPDLARDFLERGGHFKVRGVTFSEAIAFPLSGGYVARPLAPRSAAQLLFALDTVLIRILGRGSRGAIRWSPRRPERQGNPRGFDSRRLHRF